MLQQTALDVLFSDLLVVVLVTIEELLFGEKVSVPRTTNLKCQLMQLDMTRGVGGTVASRQPYCADLSTNATAQAVKPILRDLVCRSRAIRS